MVKVLQGPTGNPPNPPKGTGDGGIDGKPKVTASSVNADSVTSTQVCRFWDTEGGYRKVERCKFTHTMLSLKDGRYFTCSFVGYGRKDCPHASSNTANSKKVAKASPGKGNTSSKNEKVKPVTSSEPSASSSGTYVAEPPVAVTSAAPQSGSSLGSKGLGEVGALI